MNMDRPFPINKTLIWDYDFQGQYDTEDFKKWYIARVLSCGTMKDLRQLGLNIINAYFLSLNLPDEIKKFWEWYFGYAHPHSSSGRIS